MARPKKYPKLPNGYGSIKKLSGKRRRKYGVYPPASELIAPGQYAPVEALCYVQDWITGFAVLTAYHAGTYVPGMELELKQPETFQNADTELVERILADYSSLRNKEQKGAGKTFREVYEDFYSYKFERDKSRQYSKSSQNAIKAAFKNCKELHEREFADLRHDDLQAVIDKSALKHSSLELIKMLFNQMYAYAEIYELCEKDYSRHVKINIADDDEHGVPFSDADLEKLWKNSDNETVEMILVMCYSGYRISAYKTLKVNLEEKYFQGGVKTAAGKDRIVPMHSCIYDIVKKRLRRYGKLLPEGISDFRRSMYNVLKYLDIEKHTPHDCRHTFSYLCEKYGVNENDRKRMLGHSFGDVTNQVYGHRQTEDLRKEIEKIKVCH